MTTREIICSVLIGLAIGAIFSACFIAGVSKGLASRDAEMGIDSRAIIEEALHGN
jgi:Na+/alanine symporter